MRYCHIAATYCISCTQAVYLVQHVIDLLYLACNQESKAARRQFISFHWSSYSLVQVELGAEDNNIVLSFCGDLQSVETLQTRSSKNLLLMLLLDVV